MKNGGLHENWLAFFISITKNYPVNKALKHMGKQVNINVSEVVKQANINKLKIPISDIEKIKEMRAKGMSGKQIGKIYNCSDVAVYNFVKRYVSG